MERDWIERAVDSLLTVENTCVAEKRRAAK